jgi:hypothetical protein
VVQLTAALADRYCIKRELRPSLVEAKQRLRQLAGQIPSAQ